jgi:hypothetical protein
MTLTHEKDNEIIKMLEEKWNTEYGSMEWTKKGLVLATGGWSDNEEIIMRLKSSMFWLKYWKESKRGGYYLFDYHKEEK